MPFTRRDLFKASVVSSLALTIGSIGLGEEVPKLRESAKNDQVWGRLLQATALASGLFKI